MKALKEWWSEWHEFVIPVALVIAFVAFVALLCIGFSKTYSCPECEHVNHPAAKYCEECGRQLRL